MGCSHSDIFPDNLSATLPHIDIDSLKNNKTFDFTEKEIDIIQTTWKSISYPKELGIMVMTRIFTQHPEVKSVWIFASQLTKEDEIKKNPHVVYHSLKLIERFSHIIENLKTIQPADINSLVELGRKHYDYGVKEKFFKNFEACLISSLERKLPNKSLFGVEFMMAWRKLFWAIVGRLCYGMQLAEKEDK